MLFIYLSFASGLAERKRRKKSLADYLMMLGGTGWRAISASHGIFMAYDFGAGEWGRLVEAVGIGRCDKQAGIEHHNAAVMRYFGGGVANRNREYFSDGAAPELRRRSPWLLDARGNR